MVLSFVQRTKQVVMVSRGVCVLYMALHRLLAIMVNRAYRLLPMGSLSN